MAEFSDYNSDLMGEVPCEFCGVLFPFLLLTEHELMVHADEIDFDNNPGLAALTHTTEVKDDVQEKAEIKLESAPKEPQIVTEMKQTQNSETDIKKEPPVITERKQSQKPDIKKELMQMFEQLQIEKSKKDANSKLTSSKRFQAKKIEDLSEGSGEKLMVYGTDLDLDKNFEMENQSYKMPNNPLLQDLKEEEDIEDINNLSDDDSNESLEEFWKRARDFLKRRQAKNI